MYFCNGFAELTEKAVTIRAEEIFDNFGDWEELLRVHTLDIEPADYLTLREED